MERSRFTRRVRHAATIPVLAALAACQTFQASHLPSALGQTEWVLIEYSPAAGIGQVKEVPLNLYMMSLAKDGSFKAKLDCNTGVGSWSATAITADRGAITIGPVAATHALCPEGSLGEQLARDLPRMTAWSLYDGRLTLGPASGRPRYVWDRID